MHVCTWHAHAIHECAEPDSLCISAILAPALSQDFVNKEAILVWPGGPLPVDGPSRSLLCMPEPQQPDPPAHAVSKVAPAVTVRAALSCPGMSLSDSEDDGW